MKVQLPSNIVSPQDLASLVLEIETYADWFSRAAVKKQAQSNSDSPPELSPAAKEVVDAWESSKNMTRTRLDQLIKTLNELRESVSHIDITLAGPAPNKLKRTMVDWCRNNLAENALVTFSFNATLLGGMVVRAGSHIYDWSFRRQIMDNQNRFAEVLRNV